MRTYIVLDSTWIRLEVMYATNYTFLPLLQIRYGTRMAEQYSAYFTLWGSSMRLLHFYHPEVHASASAILTVSVIL